MKIRTYTRASVTWTWILLLPALVAAGCAGGSMQDAEGGVGDRLTSPDGAEIWSQSCNRCHAYRPAGEFTAQQWPVIVNHMRTRADLTRPEAEAVAAYLQEAAARSRGGR